MMNVVPGFRQTGCSGPLTRQLVKRLDLLAGLDERQIGSLREFKTRLGRLPTRLMEHPMINAKESVERSVAAPRIVNVGGRAPDIMVRIGRHVSKLTGHAPALPTPFNGFVRAVSAPGHRSAV
jgi:hypothetical protein